MDKQWVTLCPLEELPDGAAKAVVVGCQEIALFNVKGKIYALRNFCPHRGAPLSEGFIEDHQVICSWHGWQFDLSTGGLVRNPRIRVETYPVRVVEGEIQVQLEVVKEIGGEYSGGIL